jgi:hypothetical protein
MNTQTDPLLSDVDHTDPELGVLVCGLTNSLNLVERDMQFNRKKSNRVLPWRITNDDLGCVPTRPGDLCLFLDPDTNEWVLEEFLGSWWFEKTKPTSSHFIAAQKTVELGVGIHDRDSLTNQQGWVNGGYNSFYLKRGLHDVSDPRVIEGRRLGGKLTGKANSKKLNSKKWVCLETLYVTTAGPLSNYQNRNHIDTSKRVRLDDITPSSLIWS